MKKSLRSELRVRQKWMKTDLDVEKADENPESDSIHRAPSPVDSQPRVGVDPEQNGSKEIERHRVGLDIYQDSQVSCQGYHMT
jgi:hypothetical protein